MALRTCPDCGGPLSSTAKACPRCGRNTRGAVRRIGKIVIYGFVALIIFAIFYSIGGGIAEVDQHLR
jgi:hypothetical protein